MSSHPKLDFSVTPSKLIGLLDLVNSMSGRVDIARISIMLQTDVDVLLPVIDLAEAIGFLRVVDGDAELTEVGRKFVNAPPSKKKLMLREAIKNIEPFSTALKLAQKDNEFSKEELLNELDKVNFFEEESPDIERFHSFVLEWLLYTETINYSGEDKKFFKKKR
ncbi:MAG: AAA-associated domain-containing protein [Aigarchaeota archaeon]|nr:AAA-associated domain-containing protein [Aigarchaeota archaeon]MCX8193365.1 AAA-associated domain-containing protein [Nitrososphaeria archaeon]MDW7985895.1 AAA-associated domain-containing protein [Nitrososphaerota archaeon]